MDKNDPLTIKITRGEFLVIADALIARRREGVRRQQTAKIKLEVGIGMQMAEDADNLLTKLGIQELEQVPQSLPVITPLDAAAALIAQDAARVAQRALADLECAGSPALSAENADYR